MKTIKIATWYDSEIELSKLFEKLKENKIPEKDWNRVKIKIDYSGCYYEGDAPDLTLIVEER